MEAALVHRINLAHQDVGSDLVFGSAEFSERGQQGQVGKSRSAASGSEPAPPTGFQVAPCACSTTGRGSRLRDAADLFAERFATVTSWRLLEIAIEWLNAAAESAERDTVKAATEALSACLLDRRLL